MLPRLKQRRNSCPAPVIPASLLAEPLYTVAEDENVLMPPTVISKKKRKSFSGSAGQPVRLNSTTLSSICLLQRDLTDEGTEWWKPSSV